MTKLLTKLDLIQSEKEKMQASINLLGEDIFGDLTDELVSCAQCLENAKSRVAFKLADILYGVGRHEEEDSPGHLETPVPDDDNVPGWLNSVFLLKSSISDAVGSFEMPGRETGEVLSDFSPTIDGLKEDIDQKLENILNG